MINDRMDEIGTLTEGVPSEAYFLGNLNTVDYFSTTLMAYKYMFKQSEQEKERHNKVELAKNNKGKRK